MRPRMVILLILVLAAGCRTPHERKPRWEVSVNINVENRPNPDTKLSGGVALKRVVMVVEPKK